MRSALVCPLLVPSHPKFPAADLIYVGDPTPRAIARHRCIFPAPFFSSGSLL
jgi:hypothetical protein